MTEKDRQLLAEAEARLNTTGQLLVALANFLDTASMVERTGRAGLILADADAWESLNAAAAKVAPR